MNINLDKEQIELIQKNTGITLNKIQLVTNELDQPSIARFITTLALGEEHFWNL